MKDYKKLAEDLKKLVCHFIDYPICKDIIDGIDELYHRGMRQLKTNLNVYKYDKTENGLYTNKVESVLPSGTWVFIEQDEAGVYIFSEDFEWSCEVDYSINPNELFY